MIIEVEHYPNERKLILEESIIHFHDCWRKSLYEFIFDFHPFTPSQGVRKHESILNEYFLKGLK